MNQSPKLLITGASGFTGHHACSHFETSGFEVIAITRRNKISSENVQMEYCDITDKDAVRNLVKKVKPQYVLHLAGQNHVGNSWDNPIYSLEANTLSTLYLIESLRQENLNCKILVVGSALQFDPSNITTLSHPYSLSKTLQVLIAQSWAHLYKMDIIIAKPSNLIGPGFSNGVCSIFAKKIVDMEEHGAEKILEVNNLNAQRDFIDVRDAVRAYEILLKKGENKEIYKISSGTSLTLQEVINCISLKTDVKFKTITKTNHEIGVKVEVDLSKINSLGWQPKIPFETSISDILNFYRNSK